MRHPALQFPVSATLAYCVDVSMTCFTYHGFACVHHGSSSSGFPLPVCSGLADMVHMHFFLGSTDFARIIIITDYL
jgi:hypothetical protein